MVIYGETNTDGTGSAANLTSENGTEVVWSWVADGVYAPIYEYDYMDINKVAGHIDVFQEEKMTFGFTNYGTWNAKGLKEVYIDASDLPNASKLAYMYVRNFVDVDIDLGTLATSSLASDISFYSTANLYVQFRINIYDAKRGYIDASESTEDVGVMIQPYSNGSSWSNLFEVETGSGDDVVWFESYIYDGDDFHISPSSKWTEFDVSLGDGNDTFIYSIHEAYSDDMTRFVDAGDGFDSLLLHRDSDDIEFSDFELITVDGDGEEIVTLAMDQELLEDNSSSEQGLILDSVEVELTDDYTSIEVADLSQAQSDYLSEHDLDSSEFASVIVTYGDDSYTLLTNEVSDAWS